MTNAYLICGDHMQPATDKFCPICREKERMAREKVSVIILLKATN